MSADRDPGGGDGDDDEPQRDIGKHVIGRGLSGLAQSENGTTGEATGARCAALGVLDERCRELDQFLTQGLSDDAEQAISARPHGRGVLGMLITDPRPLRISDLGADPDLRVATSRSGSA